MRSNSRSDGRSRPGGAGRAVPVEGVRRGAVRREICVPAVWIVPEAKSRPEGIGCRDGERPVRVLPLLGAHASFGVAISPGKALDVGITYNEPLGLTVTKHTYRHFPRASIAFANCDATQSLFHLSTDPPHPPSQGMP
jgi:hypothetical protein